MSPRGFASRPELCGITGARLSHERQRGQVGHDRVGARRHRCLKSVDCRGLLRCSHLAQCRSVCAVHNASAVRGTAHDRNPGVGEVLDEHVLRPDKLRRLDEPVDVCSEVVHNARSRIGHAGSMVHRSGSRRLQLRDAKARIARAHCSLLTGRGDAEDSNRPAGAVLDQRPRGKMRLANGATVTLVVSNGRSPA